MKQAYTEIDSPVGRLLLAGRRGSPAGAAFREGRKAPTPQADWVPMRPFRPVVAAIARPTFAGELREFAVNLTPKALHSNAGVAGALADSVWRDDFLRTTRAQDR